MSEFVKPNCQTECPVYQQYEDQLSQRLESLTKYCLGPARFSFENDLTSIQVTVCDSLEYLDSDGQTIEPAYVKRREIE